MKKEEETSWILPLIIMAPVSIFMLFTSYYFDENRHNQNKAHAELNAFSDGYIEGYDACKAQGSKQ